MLEIAPYDPAMAPEVAAAYSVAFRDVPHCYPVAAATFAAAVADEIAPEPKPTHPERRAHPRAPLCAGAAFVALDRGAVVGFVDAVVEAGDPSAGAIRCLWYDRGERRAGHALLTTAERHLREQGATRIDAYRYEHRYHFYGVEHTYLSGRLDHVHALLGASGYQPLDGEVVLDWPDYHDRAVAPEPPLAVEIRLHWMAGVGQRPGLVVTAHQSGREVGLCAGVSGGDYSAADEAQDWLYTAGLGVAEELQGKGLGRYLLRRLLHELRGVGYRHASLCSLANNYRALLLYGNLGYRAVDWTWAWRKELVTS